MDDYKVKQYRKLIDKLIEMKWITVNEIIDKDAIAHNFQAEHDKIERALMLKDFIDKITNMKHFYSSEFGDFMEALKQIIKS